MSDRHPGWANERRALLFLAAGVAAVALAWAAGVVPPRSALAVVVQACLWGLIVVPSLAVVGALRRARGSVLTALFVIAIAYPVVGMRLGSTSFGLLSLAYLSAGALALAGSVVALAQLWRADKQRTRAALEEEARREIERIRWRLTAKPESVSDDERARLRAWDEREGRGG